MKSGAVKEGPTQVRIEPIRGPGLCGADFPLKVEAFAGDRPVYGFAEELRPPGSIPGASQPRWPIVQQGYGAPQGSAPRYAAPSQPSYAPPQPAAPQTIQSQSLPPVNAASDSQYTPRGAPRVDAPMTITPHPEPPRLSNGARPLGASAATMPSSPMQAGGSRYQPAPQEPEEAEADEDDIPDDAILPQKQPELRGKPLMRATPVPLGTRPQGITGSAGPVEVKPAATLACPIVSALDQWIINAVQPAAQKWLGQPVTEIKQISAYSCRGMNGQRGARISEHAFGNALDIAAFVLADGRRITVKDGWYGLPEEQGFLRDVQGAACQQFTTVLAPGSNRFHYDHIHVDLMRRASGRVACNPRAMSGEVAAARARQRGNNWARKGDTSITGSIKKTGKVPHLFGPLRDDEELEDAAAFDE
ncbi:MAG: extensin family protein [Pseudorhodoplanes sp.]